MRDALTRYTARAILAPAILVGTVCALVAGQGAALAGTEWCAEDPVFRINATPIQLTALWPSAYQAQSVTYVVDVPKNSAVSVNWPAGQTVQPSITFNPVLDAWDGTAAFSVMFHVTVNASASFPDGVSVNTGGVQWTTTGLSNVATDVLVTVSPSQGATMQFLNGTGAFK